MTRSLRYLPPALIAIAVIVLVAIGPIEQFASYHDFADQRVWLGISNAADVLSNGGFLLCGLWGLHRLWPRRRDPAIAAGWPGYQLFLYSLILTSAGSAFYHLAPDNARLVWDRLPIALACAGLLAGVRGETVPGANSARSAVVLAAAALISVAWWYFTDRTGHGDLRPYLLLQGLPLAVIPLWQAIYKAPRADRLAFAVAISLYMLAKVAELHDQQIFALLHWIAGHTVKHLLATCAAFVIVANLTQRGYVNSGDNFTDQRLGRIFRGRSSGNGIPPRP